jgi:hypothetical protein
MIEEQKKPIFDFEKHFFLKIPYFHSSTNPVKLSKLPVEILNFFGVKSLSN